MADSARRESEASAGQRFCFPSGMLRKLALAAFIGALSFAYQSIQPPPAKICGSPGGPPVTGPRVQLKDGRYIAYKEHGAHKHVARHREPYQNRVRQQGEFESLHRDLNVGFGTWSFDPMELKNPFANNEGSVHLWHGDEDAMVPVLLQRYIAKRLPWIRYHELKGIGHMFPWGEGMGDAIIRTLILG